MTNKFKKMLTFDENQKELILNIANYIIETEASLSKAAKEFSLGKTTVGDYMNYNLPSISREKYIKVRKILDSKKCTSVISNELKERIILESELLKRGYTLSQVAYLVNNSYSSTQRDISNRLPKINEETSNEMKKILVKNKSKIYA